MSKWRPIETAPKDGTIVQGFWNRPVYMAYMNIPDKVEVQASGWWPFKRKKTEIRRKHGWRVVIMGRKFDWHIHGNYGPFEPTHWMPLPEPPDE